MARLSASKPTAFDASDAYTWLIMHDCVLHDLAIKDMGLWLRGLGSSRLGSGVIVVVWVCQSLVYLSSLHLYLCGSVMG
jgi:hypothetical protein